MRGGPSCGIHLAVVPTMHDTAELLARVPVFEQLAPTDLERVAEVAVPRRFESRRVVFREGDDSDTCHRISASTRT